MLDRTLEPNLIQLSILGRLVNKIIHLLKNKLNKEVISWGVGKKSAKNAAYVVRALIMRFMLRPCRARRFGKSIAANMGAAYYDKSCDSQALFAGLGIGRDPSFEKGCSDPQNLDTLT